MKRIGILGGGSWGTALSVLLAKKGYDVELWIRNETQIKNIEKTKENTKYLPGIIIPSNTKITNNIEKAVKDKDVLVLAVPSHSIREILKQIKDNVTSGQIIVNVAKGLEPKTLLRISEVIKQEIPDCKFAVLTGPSHAEEVAKDIPTTIVVASKEKEVAEYVQEMFTTSSFRVYTNPDIIGAELGGAFKNIIALGAGISDGLGYGDNTKAALMNRGIIEITRLGEKMGAHSKTFAGLTGIGDLIVTCTSMHSRNRRAGILIGKGMKINEAVDSIGMVVEGISATKAAYKLSKKYEVKMPIVEELYGVLYEGNDVKESVINLMLRDKKTEMEYIIKDEENLW